MNMSKKKIQKKLLKRTFSFNKKNKMTLKWEMCACGYGMKAVLK